jgi:hypothetical protein
LLTRRQRQMCIRDRVPAPLLEKVRIAIDADVMLEVDITE